MTTLRNRTARTATLGAAALALGLFASTGIASAGTQTQASGQASTKVQSAAVEQTADEKKPLSRIQRNRAMGFGRRGGDR